jgi:putative transcriptional regulator
MIRCYLSRLLGEKRIKISDLARDTGINRGTLTRLYHETAERVDLDVLNELCEYLDCRLEELIAHVPDDGVAKKPNSPVSLEN